MCIPTVRKTCPLQVPAATGFQGIRFSFNPHVADSVEKQHLPEAQAAGTEKGCCCPGQVAAQQKPSERQKQNQQQFCGQLAAAWLCKASLAGPATRLLFCQPWAHPDRNPHSQSNRFDSSGAAEMPPLGSASSFLQSKQHFILLTQIGGA